MIPLIVVAMLSAHLPAQNLPEPEQYAVTGPKAPWLKRRPVGSRPYQPKGAGLLELARWPAIQASPSQIDDARFVQAYRLLCPRFFRNKGQKHAAWVLQWSRHFGVDPFMVAAVVTYRSHCRKSWEENGSYGLAAINLKMHQGYIKKRQYHYFVRAGEGWAEKHLSMEKHLFFPGALRGAQSNIYFAAALLKVFGEQCADIDSAFGSVKHRHPVSHFYWGDRVRGTADEDRMLTVRARFLEYYGAAPAPRTVSYRELTIQSPVDGGIRKLTSKMGDDRDGGGRRHKGIDFDTQRGEPVRAVADGKVIVAGVQLKGVGKQNMPAQKARQSNSSDLAAGGLLVMIRHGNGVLSAYMHLDDYHVEAGQEVKRGDHIGAVGRSGIRRSPAHLHFEFRVDGKHVDPEEILGDLVLSPLLTYRGRRLEYDQRRQRRNRWRQRRKASTSESK